MVKITKEVIKKCANSMMFNLSEDEINLIHDEFDTVLLQVSFLNSIKGLDEIEPMTFPYNDHQVIMRDDIPSTPLKTGDALKNSQTVLGNQIKLPKVVGNDNEME